MPDWEPPPCTWPLDTSLCPGWPASPEAWTPRHTLAVELATEALWERTARRYGLYPQMVRPCGSGALYAVELAGPVHAVVEVRLHERALPQEQYRLRPRPGRPDVSDLTRRGGQAWPADAVSVLYLRGRAIPLAGQRALGALASAIYTASTDGPCPSLPVRRQPVRRDGTTYTMCIPGDWQQERTGLPEVDEFLSRDAARRQP